MRGVVSGTRLALALAVAVLFALFGAFDSTPQVAVSAQEVVPAPRANSQTTPTASQYIGSGGCAARACHGSPTITLGSEWKSAFSVWAVSDPHVNAYNVLGVKASKDMAKVLGLGDPRTAARCLACHAMPVSGTHANQAAVDPKKLETLLTDGVGCEACHGPAENYLTAHTMRGWPQLGDKRFEHRYGMQNTADIAARAKICAGCHVGEPDLDGRPWRDVNHDLVAAGHPRLNFEFAAYMANLPPHWNVKKDPQRFEEVRSWVLGQFASSEAALKLLEVRANTAASANSSNDSTKQIVPPSWPEFAEYNCFACHHGLNSAIRRPGVSDAELARIRGVTDVNRTTSLLPRPTRKPGSPAWGTWYFEGPRIIAGDSALLPAQSQNSFIAALNSVATTMQTQMPNAAQVASEAAQCAAIWSKCQSEAESQLPSDSQSPDAVTLRHSIVESVALQFKGRQPECWDEFVQCYLALVAVHRSERNAAVPGDANSTARFKQTAEVLEAIRDRLSFPNEEATEAQRSQSSILRVLHSGVNSPDRFDPYSKQGRNAATAMSGKNLFELFESAIQLLAPQLRL